MKLEKIAADDLETAKDLYVVEEISAEDITLPTKQFLLSIRDLAGFSFLNTFTIGEFAKQVRRRFASNE